MKKLTPLFVATVIAATMALPAMSQDIAIIAGSPSQVAKQPSQHIPANAVVTGTWSFFPSIDGIFPVSEAGYTFSNHGTISYFNNIPRPPPFRFQQPSGSYWITGSHITAIVIDPSQNIEDSFSGVVDGDTMHLRVTRKQYYESNHRQKRSQYRFTYFNMTLYRMTPINTEN